MKGNTNDNWNNMKPTDHMLLLYDMLRSHCLAPGGIAAWSYSLVLSCLTLLENKAMGIEGMRVTSSSFLEVIQEHLLSGKKLLSGPYSA